MDAVGCLRAGEYNRQFYGHILDMNFQAFHFGLTRLARIHRQLSRDSHSHSVPAGDRKNGILVHRKWHYMKLYLILSIPHLRKNE